MPRDSLSWLRNQVEQDEPLCPPSLDAWVARPGCSAAVVRHDGRHRTMVAMDLLEDAQIPVLIRLRGPGVSENPVAMASLARSGMLSQGVSRRVEGPLFGEDTAEDDGRFRSGVPPPVRGLWSSWSSWSSWSCHGSMFELHGNARGGFMAVRSDLETLNNVVTHLSDIPMGEAYFERHGIDEASVLTVIDDETAAVITDYLDPRIAGKTVVEIGGGIGLLAFYMGTLAKKVFCIEANPVWATTFTAVLLATKPKNVSYLFGAADEFVGSIQGDVAILCSHSGISGMKAVASRFAPVVIDVYGEIIASNPKKFDALARTLRSIT